MPLTTQQIQGLDIGLNEATLLGVEVDTDRRLAAVTFAVFTLPESGPPSADRRVQFLFWPIGRVVASLRTGHWDDPTAEIVKFEVEDLLSVVQSFDGLDIYGWEFFDVNDGKGFIDWASRVSLDYRSGSDGLIHTLDLFQEGAERHLDLRIWFDELMLRNADGEEISWEEFVAGGERWWNGLNRGDERTQGFGIELLK